MSSIRAFVAIELSTRVLDALEEIQTRLRRSKGAEAGRWTRRESIHLTLKFLGQVPLERVEAICEALRVACERHQPFSLQLSGLGCFPNTHRPRVIWVGVRQESGELAALQREIESALERLGFPREKRPFAPHLTLARVHKQASRWEVVELGRAVTACQVGEMARMRVSEVHLIKSDLKPGGAIYTEMCVASLGDASQPGDRPPHP